MTILHSCCCWKSVRHGSIACGVYTGIYYSINAVHSSYLLHEEIRFFENTSSPSLIDHKLTSGTSAVFSSLIFAFSSCGMVSTILLFYGIYKDIKYLLIPWIFNMVFFTIVDIIYVIHGLVIHALQWNPSVAILITIDFFLNTLNLYTILCVISQYQEYKAGRGKAVDAVCMAASSRHQFIITQPTATSFHSTTCRKPRMYLDKDSRVHSPSALGTTGTNHMQRPRKFVKFVEGSEVEKAPMSPLWEETNHNTKHNSPCRGIDTTPLIDRGGTMEHA